MLWYNISIQYISDLATLFVEKPVSASLKLIERDLLPLCTTFPSPYLFFPSFRGFCLIKISPDFLLHPSRIPLFFSFPDFLLFSFSLLPGGVRGGETILSMMIDPVPAAKRRGEERKEGENLCRLLGRLLKQLQNCLNFGLVCIVAVNELYYLQAALFIWLILNYHLIIYIWCIRLL